MPGNFDLKIEVEPQNPQKRKRDQAEFPTSVKEYAATGFRCLDHASTEPYSNKERRGEAPDANYSKRWD